MWDKHGLNLVPSISHLTVRCLLVTVNLCLFVCLFVFVLTALDFLLWLFCFKHKDKFGSVNMSTLTLLRIVKI